MFEWSEEHERFRAVVRPFVEQDRVRFGPPVASRQLIRDEPARTEVARDLLAR